MDASTEILVDFHTHSHFSDGVLAPAALVERARTRKVGILALTDHDTSRARAARTPAFRGIRFVPGCSCRRTGAANFHIVVCGDESTPVSFAPDRGTLTTPDAPKGDRRTPGKTARLRP